MPQHGTAPTAFYSAVKKFGRTLHTVCSPILFCPLARGQALRLRQAERLAEEAYREYVEAHGVSSPSASEAKTPVGQSDVDSPTVGVGGGPPITSPIFALNDGKRKYVDFRSTAVVWRP